MGVSVQDCQRMSPFRAGVDLRTTIRRFIAVYYNYK